MNFCNTTQNVYDMRKWCLKNETIPEECFSDDLSSTFRLYAAIWGIFVTLIGVVGNSLTLLAVTRAIKRKKFGLNHNRPVTMLLLHLSFSDLAYSFVGPPSAVIFYLDREQALLNASACTSVSAVRHIIAYAEFITLGFIALFRCLGLLKPEFTERVISVPRNLVFIIAGLWIYVTGLLLPTCFGFGTFGFNCRMGCCDFISVPSDRRSNLLFQKYFMAVAYLVPFAMILTSYAVIWWKVKKAQKLDRSDKKGSGEQKMTGTILLICFSFCVFVMPAILMDILNGDEDDGDWILFHHLATIWFWCHLLVNLGIYWIRCDQYREAYNDFFWMLRKNLSDLVESSEERTPSCSRPTLFIDKGLVSGFLNESFGRVHVTTFRSFKKKDNQGNPTAFCTEVNDFQVDNEEQVEGHIAKLNGRRRDNLEISVIMLEEERLKNQGPRIVILSAQPGIKQVSFHGGPRRKRRFSDGHVDNFLAATFDQTVNQTFAKSFKLKTKTKTISKSVYSSNQVKLKVRKCRKNNSVSVFCSSADSSLEFSCMTLQTLQRMGQVKRRKSF